MDIPKILPHQLNFTSLSNLLTLNSPFSLTPWPPTHLLSTYIVLKEYNGVTSYDIKLFLWEILLPFVYIFSLIPSTFSIEAKENFAKKVTPIASKEKSNFEQRICQF